MNLKNTKRDIGNYQGPKRSFAFNGKRFAEEICELPVVKRMYCLLWALQAPKLKDTNFQLGATKLEEYFVSRKELALPQMQQDKNILRFPCPRISYSASCLLFITQSLSLINF